MEIWKSKNNTNKQNILTVACIVVGGILIYLFYNYGGPDADNARYGLMLGIFIEILGTYTFLTSGKQEVIIDPNQRNISIETTTYFKKNKRLIGFDEIEDISVGFLGKRSNYVSFYYLALTLQNGEKYSLFSPGYFYDGSSSRLTVEKWKDRLLQYMQNSITK